jgi:hypothetical protein
MEQTDFLFYKQGRMLPRRERQIPTHLLGQLSRADNYTIGVNSVRAKKLSLRVHNLRLLGKLFWSYSWVEK